MSARREPVSPERALATAGGRIPGAWLLGGLAALAVGGVGFFLAAGTDPQRAWMSVWMNFLLWSSLAIAGVVFGAVLQTAKGHWGKGFRRLAEGAGAFLPVSFVLFFVLLLAGAEHIFPWLGPLDVHVNRVWLDLDAMIWRDGSLLLVLYGAAAAFLWYSNRTDAPLMAERHTGWRRGVARTLARRWRGDAEEMARCRTVVARLAPALILAWAVVFTVIAVDFAKSLTPGFLSMIWGPYFFVGGWLSMLALVAVMAHFRQAGPHGPLWSRWEFHDLGKLIFAFCIFWAYLWFSQYFIIWYGNLPFEVDFFIPRTGGTFSTIYWLQIVLIFGLPFVLLLGRKPKMSSAWLAFVAGLILAGFWIERYNLVVPSIWRGDAAPLGWPELTISVGFVGLFGLCYAAWLTTFPTIPLRDTLTPGTAGHGP